MGFCGKQGLERADTVLAAQGLAESREKAKRLIMAGLVYQVCGERQEPVTKPGHQVRVDAVLGLKSTERYVSRGGQKLATALEYFYLDVRGVVALDAGASTGGFTDCLLQAGAARVYAVDVGRGQLHGRLLADSRVVNMERVNLRHAAPDLLPEAVDLVVVDCSFISLRMILPPCLAFLKPGGQIVALVKPQFEVGPELAVKGVVRSEEAQLQAVDGISEFARSVLHLEVQGVVPAAIRGPKGNQEYLLLLSLPKAF